MPAAIVGGVVGGAVAGVGARLAMWVIRLMNSTHDGEVTHAGYEVGRLTLSGTASLVTEGVFFGVLGGAFYLVLRPLLPRRRSWLRGLSYGLGVFVVFDEVVLDGSYEYFRFVSTWVAVAMFAALYPLYGVVVAAVADRIAPPPLVDDGRRRSVRVARAVLLVLGVVGLASAVEDVRRTYFG